MDEVNPYASPQAVADGDSPKPTPDPTPWRSWRGASAAMSFGFAALWTAMTVQAILAVFEGDLGSSGVLLVGSFALSAVAFVFVGWGIRSRRGRVVLIGFACLLLKLPVDLVHKWLN
jgi:hypothetical protein